MINWIKSLFFSQQEVREPSDSSFELWHNLSVISSDLLNPNKEDFEQEIQNALNKIGASIGVDRAYIFQIDGKKMSNTYEWTSQNVEPQKSELQDLPKDTFPWWMEKLSDHESIELSSLADLPDRASKTREILEKQDIDAVIIVPLVYNNNLEGFIGFDSVTGEREWSDEKSEILEIVGNTFVNVLKSQEQNYRLQTLKRGVERAGHAILITDLEGNITYVNKSFLDITGYSEDEVLGRTPDLLNSGKHDEEFFDELWSTIKSGDIWKGEIVNQKKDGTEFESRHTIAPIKGDEDDIQGFIAIYDDITEEKNNRKELQKARKRLKILFDKSPDGVVVHDSNGKIFDVNNTQSRHLGYEKDELRSMNVADIEKGIKKTKLKELWGKMDVGVTEKVEGEHLRKDGSSFSVEVWLTKTEIGGEERFIALSRDISEKKMQNQRVRATKDRLRQIIDNLPQLIFAKDKDGKFLLANKAVANAYGTTVEELEGETDAKFADSMEEVENFRADDMEVIESGETKKIPEETLTTAEGEKKIVQTTKIPYQPVGSENNAILGVSYDITERKERENRLKEERNMFAQGPAVVFKWEKSEGWPVEYVSENVKEALGYTPEQLKTGEVLYADLIHPEDIDRVASKVEQKNDASTEHFSHDPYRMITSDGEVKWFKDNTTIIREDGEITHYQGYLVDITEMKRKEKQLSKTKERLDLAIEGAQLGIWDWNVKTDSVEFSEEWANILGYDIEDIDQNLDAWSDRVHPEDIDEAEEKVEKHLNGETDIYTCDHRMKTKSGNYMWIRDVGKVVERDSEGEAVRAVGVHIDIDEMKKAKEREDFLHSLLRHDLKNKTHATEGYLELIQDTETTEEQEELLNSGLRTIKAGNKLIERVKKLRKLEDNEKAPISESVNVAKKEYEGKIQIQDKTGDLSFDSGELLKEVFLNILANAVDHSDGDTVIIESSVNEEEIEVSFSDNGEGIGYENKDKIFEKGFKNPDDGGDGLGLYLSKKIVDSYHGRITVEESLKGGAKFSVLLPREK